MDDNVALELYKNESSGEGRARIVGASRPSNDILGVSSPIPSWREYYAMYKSHAIVHGAINKLVFTSTSAGYDYVPRDTRAPANEAEVRKLKRFFRNQTSFITELRSVYLDLMVFGNGYLYVVPDRLRRPHSLHRVAPYTITPIVNNTGQIIRYEQRDPDKMWSRDDDVIKFAPHEMIHIKFPNPINDVIGLPPLEAIRLPVMADIAAQHYNIAFFQNSGVTGTIIAIKNANPDETERNKKFLMENYMGLKAAHKPLVVEGESVSVHKAVASHNEMGFLEGRRFLLQEILAVLDVPPAKIGIMETANRSNSREQDKTFRTESVTFIQYLVTDAINDHFIRPILGVEDTIIRHQQSDTRDNLEMMDYYDRGIRNGSMSINEVRAELGKSPAEGGDVHILQTSVGALPLTRIEEYFVPPQQPPGTPAEPLPKPTPESRNSFTGLAREANKSAENYDDYYHQALLSLSEGHIEKAYSFLCDTPHLEARTLVVKALQAENDLALRRGYIERGKDILSTLVQGSMTHV